MSDGVLALKWRLRNGAEQPHSTVDDFVRSL
ncbi:hypothetical protein J2T09_001476 [Neorhizobium huautlense]|uniref:Transposase n=1 Tax=Neorhizobium huautlense TaxID=67774 RepID=A0ABT9PQH9_9HYPH|nr:hypothetical protein [Neorhizobium huautlense]